MFPATTREGGVHMTAAPLDVCLTPAPSGGPVPIPYANMVDGLAVSGDTAATLIKMNIIDSQMALGRSPTSATQAAILSHGDEAGVATGIASGTVLGPARFIMGSTTVKAEGTPAVNMVKVTGQNAATNAAGTTISPSQVKVLIHA